MFQVASILIALFIIFISFCVYVHLKHRRFWNLINKFPGNKPLPIIGNALEFLGSAADNVNKVEEIWNKHNRSTFKFQIVNVVFLLLNHPDDVEPILTSTTELEKITDYRFLKPWLGNGLLLASGNRWKRHRKIITPAFHFSILEKYIEVFDSKGQIFLKKLAQKKGKVFDVYPLVTLCALDIICESAMGTNVNAQEQSESKYVKAVFKMAELFHARSLSAWKRFDFLYQFSSSYREEQRCLKELHGLTNKVIQSRKMLIKSNKNHITKTDVDDDNVYTRKNKVAFLDLLLMSKTPEGDPLSDEMIREEVDTFMFEGHDTSSSCISFALYLLANNPEVQNIAYEEQLNLMGLDLCKQPNYSDLQEMKYLERVVKETLRIYPSVPIFGRTLKNDVILPGNRIIPAGTHAVVNVIAMGRHPKYFPDPDKFEPDRFLFENSKNRHPFLSIPFSGGPRNCIGQKFALLEIKSLLSKVLRNYELIADEHVSDIIMTGEIVLRSQNGMKIGIKDRIPSNLSNT